MIAHHLILAAGDARFRRDDYRVVLTMHALLDWREFRQAKLIVVATRCHLTKAMVSKSIVRLSDWQYLEVGPHDDGIKTYRLMMPTAGVAARETARVR